MRGDFLQPRRGALDNGSMSEFPANQEYTLFGELKDLIVRARERVAVQVNQATTWPQSAAKDSRTPKASENPGKRTEGKTPSGLRAGAGGGGARAVVDPG